MTIKKVEAIMQNGFCPYCESNLIYHQLISTEYIRVHYFVRGNPLHDHCNVIGDNAHLTDIYFCDDCQAVFKYEKIIFKEAK